MCFSATVSYSAAAMLLGTGLYALQQARRLQSPPYWPWALIPVFFGIQQAFEGRVWQMLDGGNAAAALPYALGFHFFSHFLWLWLLPLCCYLLEPASHGLRRRLFGGIALFGAFSGALVYAVMLLHPQWMSLAVQGNSIVYDFVAPYRSPIDLPVTPMMLYGLIILVPLLGSGQPKIRLFGVLVALSMALASAINNKAFVSVWCFFAALLSLYIVHMIRSLVAASEPRPPA